MIKIKAFLKKMGWRSKKAINAECENAQLKERLG